MQHVSSGLGKQASCELNTCYTCHLGWESKHHVSSIHATRVIWAGKASIM